MLKTLLHSYTGIAPPAIVPEVQALSNLITYEDVRENMQSRLNWLLRAQG